jgi:hypothetical protein
VCVCVCVCTLARAHAHIQQKVPDCSIQLLGDGSIDRKLRAMLHCPHDDLVCPSNRERREERGRGRERETASEGERERQRARERESDHTRLCALSLFLVCGLSLFLEPQKIGVRYHVAQSHITSAIFAFLPIFFKKIRDYENPVLFLRMLDLFAHSSSFVAVKVLKSTKFKSEIQI